MKIFLSSILARHNILEILNLIVFFSFKSLRRSLHVRALKKSFCHSKLPHLRRCELYLLNVPIILLQIKTVHADHSFDWSVKILLIKSIRSSLRFLESSDFNI